MDFSGKTHEKNGFLFKMGGSNDDMCENSFLLMKSKMVGGMGFRDLTLFNDSLLEKQAWRVLNNKDSLFYRIFKALFFPICFLMEAKESTSGSYAWKSILQWYGWRYFCA